jgi:hypothetical protein
MKYVSPDCPEQTELLPVIAPGVPTVALMVTDVHDAELVLHVLMAVTQIFPPEEPAVALIDVVP